MSFLPTRILLATDGSKDAEIAARLAVEISGKTGSELHVVHVGNLADFYVDTDVLVTRSRHGFSYTEIQERARETLDRVVDGIEESGGEVVEAHLRMGDPDRETVELAEEIGAGLIVMGSRGLGGLRRTLMGSVSDSVVRHAHCPVLVVRGGKDAAGS